jgi:hypothetical protein
MDRVFRIVVADYPDFDVRHHNDSKRRSLAITKYRVDRRLIESVREGYWTNPLVAVAHEDGYQHFANHRRYVESAVPTDTHLA